MSSSTEPAPDGLFKVGYVRRAHGIHGDVIVRAEDEELDRFFVGARFVTDHDTFPEVEVTSVRQHKDGMLLHLDLISDRNRAEAMRGTSLLIPDSARRRLEADEYWPDQLVGLEVRDGSGNRLGTIDDVALGSAQDRLIVATAAGVVEIPFVTAIVTDVDVDAGYVVVVPPEGLLPGS